jgi:integrase
LEAIRQQFLMHLKEKNLSSATIELRDYVFRCAMAYGNIQSAEQLYDISYQDIQGIVKSFSGVCSVSSLSTVIPIFSGIIRSLCEAGLIRYDHSGIILKPFHQRDNVAGYIAQKDEDRLYRQLNESPLRNRAIVLLGLKLGLRNKDICELRLQDIDWKHELIRLNQHKNGQPLVLPLTTEVGNALSGYILDERPAVKDASSKLFLRKEAPYLGLNKVYHVFREIVDNAGIIPVNRTSRGSHLLRYTLVNRLLEAETPHQVITETLGHASKDSDKEYISMEADMLRQCSIGLGLIGKKVWEGGATNENT